MKINFIKVESSNVDKVGYGDNTLFVLFKNGGLYKYKEVPENIFNGLMNEESIGKALNKNIKKIYDVEQIWDDDPFYIENIERTEDNE